MRLRALPFVALALITAGPLLAQTDPTVGLRDNPAAVHALTNARIVTAPGNTIARGTLVIRDGRIAAVGANVATPADARVWDMAGKTLYAGFIDAYSDVGMPDAIPTFGAAQGGGGGGGRGGGGGQDAEPEFRGAMYWSPQVRAYNNAATQYSISEAEVAEELRSQGFATALAVPQVGMFRGTAAVVSLAGRGASRDLVKPDVAQSVVMQRDGTAGGGYPTSGMGANAFIRQVLLDAQWYTRAHAAYAQNQRGMARPETNESLAALGRAVAGQQPIIFQVNDEEDLQRAMRFATEFPLKVWIRGTGTEYRLGDQLRGFNAPLLLPVSFSNAPNVESADAVLNVGLEPMRNWYYAPENPARLAAMGVRFAFTSDDLGNRASFIPNVRAAVARGLSKETALAALTTVPSEYLGIQQTHGSLEVGKAANVVVASGDIFDAGTNVEALFVDGRHFQIAPLVVADVSGRWRLDAAEMDQLDGTLELTGTGARLSGSLAAGANSIRLESAQVAGQLTQLTMAIPAEPLGLDDGIIQLSASVAGDMMTGVGILADGRRFNWTGERVAPPAAPGANAAAAPAAPAQRAALQELRPSMEFGMGETPQQPANVLVRGATVWTMGPQGRLENADLLVRQGKVVQVGQNIQAPAGAVIINGAGKHVTPGLIDAHLHSGASGGINETGNAIVPEVRIGDVLTVRNMNMYWQLAGGLTTAHVMHGSANPIGGQNQVVKLRWGAATEDLKLAGAPRTVKFALGENPKRREERYPDTRMGVEQIIRDHFLAAREYDAKMKAYEQNPMGMPPRRDLRLEAIAAILNGEILVMSHSYRQDEILMLMRLAEEFGFKIKAFHHGVEAYKVAPELLKHGAGAVVWSDWSSFKIEAYDATTYNARILTAAGVLTSLHSDDSQVATRMNWEAAKTLRTGMTEEQALALVTINTAKILGIDSMVGSLEAGKDGDFVVWSGNPLSTASHAEQTWIDGRRYFDISEDMAMRDKVAQERSLLINMIRNQRGAR